MYRIIHESWGGFLKNNKRNNPVHNKSLKGDEQSLKVQLHEKLYSFILQDFWDGNAADGEGGKEPSGRLHVSECVERLGKLLSAMKRAFQSIGVCSTFHCRTSHHIFMKRTKVYNKFCTGCSNASCLFWLLETYPNSNVLCVININPFTI